MAEGFSSQAAQSFAASGSQGVFFASLDFRSVDCEVVLNYSSFPAENNNLGWPSGHYTMKEREQREALFRPFEASLPLSLLQSAVVVYTTESALFTTLSLCVVCHRVALRVQREREGEKRTEREREIGNGLEIRARDGR